MALEGAGRSVDVAQRGDGRARLADGHAAGVRRGSHEPDDRVATLAAVASYSVGLGIATLMVPLVALDAGYEPAAVGFLVATAAGCQFATRLTLPALLGRFPDRLLITMAALGLLLSFALLLGSRALPVFVLAQLAQGSSRALFWTASQTHAVRGASRPVQRLIDLNVAGNAGSLAGPALAGMLAVAGMSVPLVAGVLATGFAALLTTLLRWLPPYDRRGSAGTFSLLRRPGVDVACWASVVGGGWWSMMGSYVPVLAVSAGIGSAGVGWLLTLAEGSGMAALLVLRRLPPRHVERVVRIAATVVVLALIGLAAIAFSAAAAIAALFAVCLIIGGAASGTITTLAPAMASLAASPEEQGDAMALTGTFRAGALLAGPALVGAMLAVVGIPAAVGILAAGIGLPGLVVGGTRSDGGDPARDRTVREETV